MVFESPFFREDIMIEIYAGEPLPFEAKPSIFLAGPTPRGAEPKSWRATALTQLLQGWCHKDYDVDYQGTVFVPEPKEGPTGKWPAAQDQCIWEHRALELSTCIAFWIPRHMKDMPGLTTNVEFGLFARSNRVVLGFPPDAEHIDYIKFCAVRFGISMWNTLEDTLAAAIVLSGAYA